MSFNSERTTAHIRRLNLQRSLQMDDARLCVLHSVDSVRAAMAAKKFVLDEDDVLEACLGHQLAPWFDFGLEGRRYVRVCPSAVEFYAACGGSRTRRISDDEMFAEILRGHDGKPWIAGERAKLILNCGGDHINALVDRAELAAVPGTERRRGPNGSDRITLDSFRAYLKRSIR